ncbi:MAG: hypothetical protein WC485_00210 [Opitutaceae bacterium]
MASLERQFRHQSAVLWESAGTDDYGNPTVLEPVELFVRWNRLMHNVADARGRVVDLDALVVVDREIPIDSIMWLGRMDEMPAQPTNLKRVVDYTETPDIKGRNIYRTVGLKNYSNALPALQAGSWS